MAIDILTNKADLRDLRAVDVQPEPLGEGQVRLRLDRFALTANNVTYSAFGEMFSYWKFFPGPEGFGRSPVWGFAEVEESRSDAVKVGQRVWGYYPLGTHLVVTPIKAGPHGFVDGAEHRRGLPPVYNQYLLVQPGDARSEALTALFKPLFTTSFVIDDQFEANGFYGAETVLFASASSKTALGAAWLMRRRKAVQVVGLTSPRNVALTEKTAAYDRVVTYAEVAELAKRPTAFVDMAGDSAVQMAVHTHFADALKASVSVGATHWDAPRAAATLPGPAPTFFFAPDVIVARTKEWGNDVFQSKVEAAQAAFLASAAAWLEVDEARGVDATIAAWRALVDGRANPEQGLIRGV